MIWWFYISLISYDCNFTGQELPSCKSNKNNTSMNYFVRKNYYFYFTLCPTVTCFSHVFNCHADFQGQMIIIFLLLSYSCFKRFDSIYWQIIQMKLFMVGSNKHCYNSPVYFHLVSVTISTVLSPWIYDEI